MPHSRIIRQVIVFAIASILLFSGINTVQADAWRWINGLGCNEPACGDSFASFATQTTPSSMRPFTMRPAPPYNSSWKKIPVTKYQAQSVSDPLSGTSVMSLQPCNTYEWQMKRTAGNSCWQSFVCWWKRHFCCSAATQPPPCATCVPSSSRIVSTTSPTNIAPTTTLPYYTPTPKARLVPVPSGASPPTAVPADHPPRLGPRPTLPNLETSASRLLTPTLNDAPVHETFVHTTDSAEPTLELIAPQLSPSPQSSKGDDLDRVPQVPQLLDTNIDDHTAAIGNSHGQLVPVAWSETAASQHNITPPATNIWDDTGWQSDQ
jgi:hypothetical protein